MASSLLISASRNWTRLASSCRAKRVAPSSGGVGRPETDGAGDELADGQAPEGLAEIVGPGDDQRPHLVDRGRAVPGGGAADEPQRPDRLDIAGSSLGLRGRLAGLRCPDGGDRIDRVRLAVASTFLPVGTGHLDDRHSLPVEITGQARTVGSGALDPDALDVPEALEPSQQLVVAEGISGERPDTELSAALVERGDHVHVAVGVDARRDQRRELCQCGHRHPFIGSQPGQGWPHVPGRRTGQGRASETGAYEVTFARPVRAGGPPNSADSSYPRQPKRQPVDRVRPSPRAHEHPHPPARRVGGWRPQTSSLPVTRAPPSGLCR